jgi:glycosyltransferase involved in cell wall biosynthesis
LAEDTILSDDLLSELIAVGEVDILVGVPTYNHCKTAGQVVRAVQVGFLKYFPRARTVLINPDGGSTDGTADVVRNATVSDYRTLMTSQPLRTLHRITTPYSGGPGRDHALRTIFAAADLLRAKACAVVSAELQSVTPEWIEGLIRPVYKEQFDLVTPLYHRHKFDGLLINNVVYPMVRAVYGSGVKEPLGKEFGVSGRLAKALLEGLGAGQPLRSGIDLRLTTSAIRDGYLLCQTFLGPKIHAPNYAEADLTIVLPRVIGTLFECMGTDEAFWFSRSVPAPLPTFGFQYDLSLEPVRVNRDRMLQVFRNGVREFASILSPILSPATLEAIQRLIDVSDADLRFPDELWVKTIYEFAASYHHGVIHRDHLLQALVPLYLGRTSSFVAENLGTDSMEFEQRLEGLCLEYERLKPYLIERWKPTT